MPQRKTEDFSVRANKIARYAKAMGHPARVAIMQFLLKRKKCVCGDIVDEIPLAQSTISQHLKELKNVGLIQGEISGVHVCYCINEIKWNEACRVLNSILKPIESSNNCCVVPEIVK